MATIKTQLLTPHILPTARPPCLNPHQQGDPRICCSCRCTRGYPLPWPIETTLDLPEIFQVSVESSRRGTGDGTPTLQVSQHGNATAASKSIRPNISENTLCKQSPLLRWHSGEMLCISTVSPPHASTERFRRSPWCRGCVSRSR